MSSGFDFRFIPMTWATRGEPPQYSGHLDPIFGNSVGVDYLNKSFFPQRDRIIVSDRSRGPFVFVMYRDELDPGAAVFQVVPNIRPILGITLIDDQNGVELVVFTDDL